MNSRITPTYWMKIAVEVAKASTCRAEVGCILVHKKTLVGMGYVGSVHGDAHCDERDHILVKTEQKGSTKNGDTCIRTIHAEMNAVLKCTIRGSEENGWIDCYSTYQPCLECTKILFQIGVRTIYYIHPYKDKWREIYMEEFDLYNDEEVLWVQVKL